MFDHATNGMKSWADEISVGDVVLFAYPVADPETGAKPKIRPCLVLESSTHQDGKRVLLAFGTSTPARCRGGYDITLRHPGDLIVAGLVKPTRFVASRFLSVSVGNPGFGTRDRETPVLGRLSAASAERMNRVRARLHAEHDIAAERRKERAAQRLFTVEHRKRKPLVSQM